MGTGIEKWKQAIMQIILIAVSIPAIFSDEHSRRTDQIVLCTDRGRGPLYLAKMFTGLTYCLIATLILSICSIVPTLFVSGTDGFGAPLQVAYPLLPWQMTVGEGMVVMLFMMLLASVLYASFAMVMAEKSRSNVAPMAVMVGFMLICLIANVPEKFLFWAKIWALMPGKVLSLPGGDDSFIGLRLFHVMGESLMTWQMAAVVWGMISVVLLSIGYRWYKNSQVTGR